MGKRALIISTTETFTVRGLEMKLKGIDIEPAFSVPKIDDVEPLCDAADIFILYTDDAVDKGADAYVYIKDHCMATDKYIIVIGANTEYEIVRKYISDSCILNFYERPLDMEKFLSYIENYLKKSSNQEKKKSILIVDDDVSYMTMIMDWLKDTYRVSLANSGMQAITWLAKNEPDLILLDYEMPVTTGPQVLEMIRSDESTSSIPVMFLTGKGDKESIMKVLSLKPAGYLLKSINRMGLRENLANYFAAQIGNKG